MSAKQLTLDDFIVRAIKVHGDEYDYSDSEYFGYRKNINIRCKIHGVFSVKASSHLMGTRCQKCAVKQLSTEDFIKRSRITHGNKYDYSLVKYKTNGSKVKIICPKHGVFNQVASSHMIGKSCRLCELEDRGDTFETFKIKANKIYGNKYDYSLVKYKNSKTHIDILCKEHGIFSQTPSRHINNNMGCDKCRNIHQSEIKEEDFIKKATEVHKKEYKYDNTNYNGVSNKVNIKCKKHGYFMQYGYVHLRGAGCPRCGVSHSRSKNEIEIIEHLKERGINIIESDRRVIAPLELDIVIPDIKIAIEYNGIYWHSEKHQTDKNYHKKKTDLAKKAGYRLIHIWEDSYNKNKEKELSFLDNICGIDNATKIYARKTTLKIISNKIASSFFEEYHIQGTTPMTFAIGAYLKDELVSVTGFKKDQYGWKLVRHTNSKRVIGSLGKASKWFLRNYKQSLDTFCDISRFDGVSYERAGFEKNGLIPPDYMYVVKHKRKHKFAFRKSKIKKKYPQVVGNTEKEMMLYLNIPRIWDCGKQRYTLRYKDE